jgi:NADH dehydrogenase
VDAAGTENLVEAAKMAGVERYIYLSGAGAAKDAERHWFRAKWRAEEAVCQSGMTFTIVRPAWIYGPEDNALNRFLKMARFMPFVPLIGRPSQQRMQPVFIDDVGGAVAESVDNVAADNRVFELGGPEVLTMTEIVKTALEVAGRRRLLVASPRFVMKAVASVVRFLPGPPLTPDAIDFVTGDALGDPTEIQSALGFKVTPLREALSTYLGSGRE